MLAQLGARRSDVGNRHVGPLQRDGQVSFGRLHGQFIGFRIDPEQDLSFPDRAIVLHADLEHVAGDLGRDLRQEGLTRACDE